MNLKLVFVHGRDQQGKNPADLKKEWLDTLVEGLEGQSLSLPSELNLVKDIFFPFYGDELDTLTQSFDVPIGDAIRTRGGNIDTEYQVFRGELLEQFRKRANIPISAVNEEYGENPKPRAPQNWEWVQAILRTLDRNTSVGADVIERFTRDVYLYLTKDVVRTKIKKIVASDIFPKEHEALPDKTIIIAHSLGSIVAYDILKNDPRSLNIPLYLTVGSPLGLDLVKEKLAPIEFPKPNVKKWFNAFDQRDVVALYPLDQGNFNVAPDKIEDDDEVINDTSNHHGIIGYLNDYRISKTILDAFS